jgi:hypothetical protein
MTIIYTDVTKSKAIILVLIHSVTNSNAVTVPQN